MYFQKYTHSVRIAKTLNASVDVCVPVGQTRSTVLSNGPKRV